MTIPQSTHRRRFLVALASAALVAGLVPKTAAGLQGPGPIRTVAARPSPAQHGAPNHTVSGPGQSAPSLEAVLNQIRRATRKYQDVNVALREGYIKEDDDNPGMGAHFTNWSRGGVVKLDLTKPTFFMYTQRLGTGRWELVGVGYNLDGKAYPRAPSTLPGGHWHTHGPSCTIKRQGQPNEVIEPISKEDCRVKGGQYDPYWSWEIHVWAWLENPGGLYAEENSRIP